MVTDPRLMAVARPTPAPQYASGLERDWATQLELRRRVGLLVEWRHEAITLQLAEGSRFTPNFFVVLPNGEIELQEVKGYMREAANVRLKVAARQFPWFRFVLVRRGHGARGQWTADEVAP